MEYLVKTLFIFDSRQEFSYPGAFPVLLAVCPAISPESPLFSISVIGSLNQPVLIRYLSTIYTCSKLSDVITANNASI